MTNINSDDEISDIKMSNWHDDVQVTEHQPKPVKPATDMPQTSHLKVAELHHSDTMKSLEDNANLENAEPHHSTTEKALEANLNHNPRQTHSDITKVLYTFDNKLDKITKQSQRNLFAIQYITLNYLTRQMHKLQFERTYRDMQKS